MKRWARLWLAQLRASLVLAAQYRVELFVDGAIELLWTATTLAPLLVVFGDRRAIAGWSFGEALVVVGFFTLLQAILEGTIHPSLVAALARVRTGTFDFVLLKPADAQFLAMTSQWAPWRMVNVATAAALFAIAFRSLGRTPSLVDVAGASVLLLAAIALLYALGTLVLCAAFFAVKLDDVTDLLSALFDAARWPSSVFRGVIRVVFTYVVPIALMTTVPARALLGVVDARSVATALIGATVFSIAARWVWRRALAGYTSASS